jgi:regulator of sigma E protease
MFFTILIIFFCLIGLMVLHELGHFLMAKKFGVDVEEFGIGYPPRIFGKKFKGTLYSLNLLPFGAFVRIKGEEGEGKNIEDSKSFSQKPIWQRSLIIFGGVGFFWIIAIVILTSVAFFWGVPTSVPDDWEGAYKTEVMVTQTFDNFPAQLAGMEMGDKIIDFDKMYEFQEYIKENKEKEITLNIRRGEKIFALGLIPTASDFDENEGVIGVALARVADIKYPWYSAPIQGISITAKQTIAIPIVLGKLLKNAIKGEETPGVKLVGPIGIGRIMTDALDHGIVNFLMFLSMISIWLAVFNILPIPALDGGKLLFLAIEKVRGKAVNPKTEQKITLVFFSLLIGLMLFVTIKDIISLF